MNSNKNYGLYAIALAIALVGALALGVPIGTLAILLVVLACPLMMFFMMRGMQGGDDMHGSGRDHDDTARKRDPHERQSGAPSRPGRH